MAKTSEFQTALDWVSQCSADGFLRFSEIRFGKTPGGSWTASTTSHNGGMRKVFRHTAETREAAFVGLTLDIFHFWKPRGVQLPLMLFQVETETEG